MFVKRVCLFVSRISPWILLLAIGDHRVRGDDAKLPLPSKEERNKAVELVRDVYEDAYEKAEKTDADAAELARELLRCSREEVGNPINRFALLSESMRMAIVAGDAAAAFVAIDEIDRIWEVNAPQLRATVLSRIAQTTRSPADCLALCRRAVTLAESAAADENFELATDTITLAKSLAAKARDADLRRTSGKTAARIAARREAFELFRCHRPLLDDDPKHAEANLHTGRFLCFFRGDWKNGLSHLALGSDALLVGLATDELDAPQDTQQRLELADAWWDFAATSKGPVAEAARARAAVYYRAERKQLNGLPKLKVESRLAEVPAEDVSRLGGPLSPSVPPPREQPAPPPHSAGIVVKPPEPQTPIPAGSATPIDLLAMIDPARDTIQGKWRFENGVLFSPGEKQQRIHIPYMPPEEYRIEIVATRIRNNLPLAVGLVGGGTNFNVNLDCEGRKRGLEYVDGKSVWKGNVSVRPGKVFTTGRPARITCHVHGSGVRVTVDGRVVLDWQEGFGRLSTRPSWAPKDRRLLFVGTSCPYRIDSIVLTPISGSGQTLHPSN